MNSVIKDDFVNFVENEEYFNSTVLLYDSQGGSLVYEGYGIYDTKPSAVVDENGSISYNGEKSVLTLAKSKLTFMTSYFDLKGYYAVITDNEATHNLWISNSHYNSNAGSIFCYLKNTL